MQQLPLEGKRFATVDRMWRKATEGAKRNPNLLKVRTSPLNPGACSCRALLADVGAPNARVPATHNKLSCLCTP